MYKRVSTPRLLCSTLALSIVVIAGGGAIVPFLHAASGTVIESGLAVSSVGESSVRDGPSNEVPAGLANSIPASSPDSSVTFGVVATVNILPVNSTPVGVAVDSANGNVYVTDSGSSNVSVINGSTNKVIATIPVGDTPSGIVFDASDSEVYVANFLGSTVEVISTTTNTVFKTIPILVGPDQFPGGPVGLACDSVNGNVYVTDQAVNDTSVISGVSLSPTPIPVGGYPIAAAFDPENQDVYVANAGSANVSVISTATNTVTRTISVGSYPLGIAYDNATGNVYVTNQLSNSTSVILAKTGSVVATVPVGPLPVGVTSNSVLSAVFVADEGDSKVNVVNDTTNRVVQNVTVGQFPVGMAYDAVNGYVYVADANSSEVSVIGTSPAPPYAVEFTESGLPTGTNWSVTLEGTLGYSEDTVITFSEPNGTYTYTVGALAGYIVSPMSGSVTVDGFPPFPVAVTFSPFTYTVTFQESGLALVNNTLWSVILNGTPEASNTSTMTFLLANGTYPYTVSSVAGYSVSPGSSTVVVKGAPETIAITFGAISTAASSSPTPWWIYAVVAVVVVAVVIGMMLLIRRRKPPTPATSPQTPREGPGTSQ